MLDSLRISTEGLASSTIAGGGTMCLNILIHLECGPGESRKNVKSI